MTGGFEQFVILFIIDSFVIYYFGGIGMRINKIAQDGGFMSGFVKGDVVRLKSGGPMMTVTGINYDNDCICSWFFDNKESSAVYPPEALHSKAQVEQLDEAESAKRKALYATLGGDASGRY